MNTLGYSFLYIFFDRVFSYINALHEKKMLNGKSHSHVSSEASYMSLYTFGSCSLPITVKSLEGRDHAVSMYLDKTCGLRALQAPLSLSVCTLCCG